ncbi:hypothetical protein [Archangium violaceum]|uniref:Lipoprotein n=1 Tax=Archangium violaceum Cb vi76 TaxID=1406225 RepID=A0A084SJ50_9BACT|nr:hypothetical protein [Archangium violaceum]KFA88485.1 hypothetical protein Q664_41465 [Archangium violaceum Cb vi76]
MRKLMMAVMAVAGLGLVAGCRDSVQSERRDVAQAQQEVQQEQREMQREIAEERQEGQQELAEQRQDVQEERQELQEELREGTGGGAMAGAQMVDGRIQSATPDAVVLIVPDQNNQRMQLRADQKTQVKKDNQTMSLRDLKPGDEVRASYEMGQGGQMILRSIEVQKKSTDNMMNK